METAAVYSVYYYLTNLWLPLECLLMTMAGRSRLSVNAVQQLDSDDCFDCDMAEGSNDLGMDSECDNDSDSSVE